MLNKITYLSSPIKRACQLLLQKDRIEQYQRTRILQNEETAR